MNYKCVIFHHSVLMNVSDLGVTPPGHYKISLYRRVIYFLIVLSHSVVNGIVVVAEEEWQVQLTNRRRSQLATQFMKHFLRLKEAGPLTDDDVLTLALTNPEKQQEENLSSQSASPARRQGMRSYSLISHRVCCCVYCLILLLILLNNVINRY